MEELKCNLVEKGYSQGSCLVEKDELLQPACQISLRKDQDGLSRLITSAHLSRPENYLSIYQSGCNFSCRKCHSWYFSKKCDGEWFSPADILRVCQEYEGSVNLREPREKATAWHAHDTCRCCGSCILKKVRAPYCPGALDPGDILLSPQGWGPVRNIVAFTGGDLCCRPEFYAQCTRLIKQNTKLWVLIETNGYGLVPEHLDLLEEAGVNAYWLDIKAYDNKAHQWLTGCSNGWIRELPREIVRRGFTLEVLSLYIPGLVDTSQLIEIAKLLQEVDDNIPFTILGFFPEHRMKDFRSPRLGEMIEAYQGVRSVGLKKVRLGNTGVFARGEEEYRLLEKEVGIGYF